MTRTMYDSVSPGAIPQTAKMVAGYVDGRYVWAPAGWARFPNAVHVRIAVFATTNDGVVLDVETGDATPAQAPGWVQRRRAAGIDPSVYCNTSVWPSVRAAFQAARVPEPHYWVAAYPGGGAVIPAGAIAHQYADPLTSGGNFDLSIVADYWPGVDTGANVALTDTDVQAVSDRVMSAFTSFRPVGPDGAARNIWDAAYQSRADAIAIAAAVKADAAVTVAVQTALAADTAIDQATQTALAADVIAIEGAVAAGPTAPAPVIDITALTNGIVAGLVPHLPPAADPVALAAAVKASIQAQFDKP